MIRTTPSLLKMGSATRVAERAADVLFVLQNKEKLDYQALTDRLNETLQLYGLQNDITSSDFVELKDMSRKLYAVFRTKDVAYAATLLNGLLSEYAYIPRLSAHTDSPWHLHVDSSDYAPWMEWFAASSTLAFATLLAEKQHNPCGLCASPSCGKPFIDLGKGGGRSYCSPRCATRERVTKYRERDVTKP